MFVYCRHQIPYTFFVLGLINMDNAADGHSWVGLKHMTD